ncbi:MAG: PqqD family protein [Clostridiales bacterium]|nr:PqqD family protein [Clostridiales bacterium]
MKLKGGFVISEIAGKMVAVPTEDDVDLNMMITLNDTGAFLWEKLKEETSEDKLVEALLAEYDVDEATARRSVNTFIGKLKGNGLIDE